MHEFVNSHLQTVLSSQSICMNEDDLFFVNLKRCAPVHVHPCIYSTIVFTMYVRTFGIDIFNFSLSLTAKYFPC